MGKNRIKKFINKLKRRINMGFKDKKNKDDFEAGIKVKYLIGSKSHTKEFKRYALFGKWYSQNWRSIRVIDVSVSGEY